MLRMKDIAVKAGVSQSTVSFVLNDRHTALRISEQTRQRVLDAAEELGYRPNHVARAIRTGKTRMLGFLGGILSNEQVGRMLEGALLEADRHGFTLKVLPHSEREVQLEQIIRRSAELRLAGVVVLHLPLPFVEALKQEAEQCNYPLVLLDSLASIADLHQVVSDDEQGIGLAVDHLAGLGHRSIAFVSGQAISTLVQLRERTFREAMTRHHLPVAAENIVRGEFVHQEPSALAARELLQRPTAERPTAICCSGDWMACAVLQVAAELGLRVPQDVSVVGFANMTIAQFVYPPLTTIEQPFSDMGRLAVRRLLTECNTTLVVDDGQKNVKPSRQSVGTNGEILDLLPTRLIERESTARAP